MQDVYFTYIYHIGTNSVVKLFGSPFVSYFVKNDICVSYCRVCAYVREDNPRFSSWIISRTYVLPYDNCLIAPACMCTLCIVRYLM